VAVLASVPVESADVELNASVKAVHARILALRI
jgi:hypothetical protein